MGEPVPIHPSGSVFFVFAATRPHFTDAMRRTGTIGANETPIFPLYIGMMGDHVTRLPSSILEMVLTSSDEIPAGRRIPACPTAVLLDDLFENGVELQWLRERFGFMKWNSKSKLFRTLRSYEFGYMYPFFAKEFRYELDESLAGFWTRGKFDISLLSE